MTTHFDGNVHDYSNAQPNERREIFSLGRINKCAKWMNVILSMTLVKCLG